MKIKVTPKNPNLPTINASDATLLRESLEAAADLAHEQGDDERLQALEGLLGQLFSEEPEDFDPTPYDYAEAVRRSRRGFLPDIARNYDTCGEY